MRTMLSGGMSMGGTSRDGLVRLSYPTFIFFLVPQPHEIDILQRSIRRSREGGNPGGGAISICRNRLDTVLASAQSRG